MNNVGFSPESSRSKILEYLDSVRKKGFRPDVVACVIHNKKVLVVYKQEFDMWEYPQGGIENGEAPGETLLREMAEELGRDFVKTFESSPVFLLETSIVFAKDKRGSRELFLDSGEEVLMKGKHYLFHLVNVNESALNIQETEFDDFAWVESTKAFEVFSKLRHKNKRVKLLNITKLLKDQEYII